MVFPQKVLIAFKRIFIRNNKPEQQLFLPENLRIPDGPPLEGVGEDFSRFNSLL